MSQDSVFLGCVTVILLITTGLWSLSGQDLGLLYGFFVLELVAAIAVFESLNPGARRALTRVIYLLLPGFGGVLVWKLSAILSAH